MLSNIPDTDLKKGTLTKNHLKIIWTIQSLKETSSNFKRVQNIGKKGGLRGAIMCDDGDDMKRIVRLGFFNVSIKLSSNSFLNWEKNLKLSIKSCFFKICPYSTPGKNFLFIQFSH